MHRFAFGICLLSVLSVGQAQDEDWPVHPDSEKKPGVPEGTLEGPFDFKSRIFPGTERQYWVYVPAQYDTLADDESAAIMIVQDGLNRANDWRIPTVLDNLIHGQEVPVQIGIFVTPGVVPPAKENAQPRFNRSFEYDSLGDRYARFLIEELIPEVGKTYRLSDDPEARCLAGASSGGICAFNAAWERPDAFRRVFCTIGTFVGLRGGNEFPTLVRKTEAKPIRVFLQDGSNDLNLYGGDWWMANQTMLSALKFSGYEVEHAWGNGGHNGRHGRAIAPDALRFLWKDFPKPVGHVEGAQRRMDLLIEGEDWELVSDGHRFTEGPAVADDGTIYFTDIPNNRIHHVTTDGTVEVFAEETGAANGLMFGPDGKLYAARNADKQIVRYSMDGSHEVVLEDAPANDLITLPNGGYFTDPDNRKVWYFTYTGERRQVDHGLAFANGVVATPDQAFLIVSDTRGHYTFSYRIENDGTLAHKQPYGYLHTPDDIGDSGADGMAVDTEGRIYVTTRMGVQVLDQPGRVHFIIRKPSSGWLSNAVFAGKDLKTLYVTCGNSVFRRKLNATGLRSWQPSVEPPKPRL